MIVLDFVRFDEPSSVCEKNYSEYVRIHSSMADREGSSCSQYPFCVSAFRKSLIILASEIAASSCVSHEIWSAGG